MREYATARSAADSLRMASAFGGMNGLEKELAELNLSAAHARLEATLADTPTPSVRQLLGTLRDDVTAAQAALDYIGKSFNEWRRKKIDDPRTGRPATATGASPLGVFIDSELVTWSDFGTHSEAISHLFEGRFDDAYSPQVERGIIALLRISAAVNVVQNASEMFFPNSGAQFTSSEALELPNGYSTLFEWLDADKQPAVYAAAQHEREAARLLGEALRATEVGDWTSAVAGMERLLSEFGDTLVVLLMSDGTS